MAGAIQSGPTPWWQLPEYAGSRKNLEQSAPDSYEYDPVKMAYTRTPEAQGAAVNAFSKAANPALAGLMSSLGSAFGAGSATGSGGPAGGFVSSQGGGLSGSGGGGVGNGFGTSGVTGGNRLASLQLPDQTASSNAAYATAKDKVGKSGRASLTALRDELGAAGALGGGAEVQGTRDIVANAAGDLGQVARDQAMKQADLSADFAKTNFAGGITQRGQDVSASEAQARLAQEGRIAENQNQLAQASLAFQKQNAASNQQLQMLQMALSGLQGAGGAGGGLVY